MWTLQCFEATFCWFRKDVHIEFTRKKALGKLLQRINECGKTAEALIQAARGRCLGGRGWKNSMEMGRGW